ncbi:unnamed protein product [Pedinophyceae sp. YPF-701]|nr:unnamed protein product [Pedinophyceae sp. YPF-701]
MAQGGSGAGAGLSAGGASICFDCQSDQVMLDAEGCRVCRVCGVVNESGVIDERTEWRNFSEKDKQTDDATRVGRAVDFLYEDGGLGVQVAGQANRGADSRARGIDKWLRRERPVVKAYVDQLKLPTEVADDAITLARDVKKHCLKNLQGVQNKALVAGCVIYAAKMNGHPVTQKVMRYLAKLDTKKLNKGQKAIEISMKEVLEKVPSWKQKFDATHQVSHPADLMYQFCGQLGMTQTQDWHLFRQACVETANAAKPKDDSKVQNRVSQAWDAKHPQTVATAIIYMLSHLPKWVRKRAAGEVTFKELSHFSGQAESTIMQAYADLYPFVRELIPKWFATTAEVAQLPPPPATGRK